MTWAVCLNKGKKARKKGAVGVGVNDGKVLRSAVVVPEAACLCLLALLFDCVCASYVQHGFVVFPPVMGAMRLSLCFCGEMSVRYVYNMCLHVRCCHSVNMAGQNSAVIFCVLVGLMHLHGRLAWFEQPPSWRAQPATCVPASLQRQTLAAACIQTLQQVGKRGGEGGASLCVVPSKRANVWVCVVGCLAPDLKRLQRAVGSFLSQRSDHSSSIHIRAACCEHLLQEHLHAWTLSCCRQLCFGGAATAVAVVFKVARGGLVRITVFCFIPSTAKRLVIVLCFRAQLLLLSLASCTFLSGVPLSRYSCLLLKHA